MLRQGVRERREGVRGGERVAASERQQRPLGAAPRGLGCHAPALRPRPRTTAEGRGGCSRRRIEADANAEEKKRRRWFSRVGGVVTTVVQQRKGNPFARDCRESMLLAFAGGGGGVWKGGVCTTATLRRRRGAAQRGGTGASPRPSRGEGRGNKAAPLQKLTNSRSCASGIPSRKIAAAFPTRGFSLVAASPATNSCERFHALRA